MVDKNEFFRQATLRICGHLNIDDAMHACAQYISQFISFDQMYLQLYHGDLDSMHLMAMGSPEKGKIVDTMIPLSGEGREMLAAINSEFGKTGFPDVMINNDSNSNPVSRSILSFLGAPICSLLIVYLKTDVEFIGNLVVVAEGTDRFTQADADLIVLLKEPFSIAMANMLKHREVIKLKDMLLDDNKYLQRELMRFSGEDIVGADFGLKNVMEMVRKVAPSDSPVLLLGETGVGKDVMANTIHYSSPRSDKPFITVNCGAIPDSLIDSELFGHEKGAFTGATAQKRGRFERADRGTIFLDEVGELPPQAQVRLLRVLQNKEFERVGGTQTIRVDVRVIAATNKHLEEMVRAGTFREDLWFRLNVFPIMIPPLRLRREDIPALTYHFLERKARQLKIASTPELASGAIDRLMDYNWPGNVRELDNVIERAIILNPQGPLHFDNLAGPARPETSAGNAKIPSADYGDNLALDAIVSAHIRRILEMTEGKIHGPEGAANLLEMNPSTLRSKMKKLGISYQR